MTFSTVPNSTPKRLEGKVAVVTGSASGIGRAIALAYHREGCTVVCSDLGPSHGEDLQTHEVITKEGGTATFCKADVSQAGDMEALVQTAVDKFVNNAGIAPEAQRPTPVWDIEESTWDQVSSINSRGVFLGVKYASRQMIKQTPLPNGNRGKIINIASILGLRGNRMTAGYVSSKHSAVGLTKAAAMDCAPHGVQVNAICPGFVETPLINDAAFMKDPMIRGALSAKHPFGGLGKPEDIANAAVFLASDENSWMTGAAMAVDGGYTCQ
ncbi:short chain type dehydrogenase, putative [Paecilomyces variotii No. 5]|uniref:Short chain type dehydrogenase, putative n=1 Tax=Byssochlamys spectabilis (strain No. 5 / NBRC 109023) TaxID=1356009 RepID=V5HRJ8_BYSSN|nr:short chain type dehydrogenase, putative [Paecilomyces variotii No. 5]